MSWLFSQALVEEFSAVTCSDGEPSAQLNVMPTQHKFSRQDKTIEPSDLSRFGLTCAVLTEGRGAALLTWYLAGFPARTSAPPAPAQELMASAPAYGGKWLESSVKYDPSASTWRTHLCLWDEALPWSSVTLPKWGMTRAGVLWEPITYPRFTNATGSGLWQTPVADDAVERKAGKWNSRGEPKLSAEVKLWPTPTASLGTKGGRITPRKGREGGTLIEAVSARMFPTPKANDALKRGNFDATNPRNGLPAAIRLEEAGLLNPEWVEWLMGWPIGWTELPPLETARFREWQQQHSIFSAAESKEAA